MSIIGVHEFSNGRRYKVTDSGKPYVRGEYPTGGYLITVWSRTAQMWQYIDNSPDLECVANFLRAAAQLGTDPGLVAPEIQP